MNVNTRLAVIGDVHCEDVRLERVLEDIARRDCSAIAQVGDIVDGEGDLDRCVALLIDANALVISGNHERWFLLRERRDKENATQDALDETKAFLASLPSTIRLATPAGDVLLGHGVGENDMAFFAPDTRGYGLQEIMPDLLPLLEDKALSFFIGGHTHSRMARLYSDLWMLNAGTLHDSGPPGYIIVDFEALQMECFDFEEGVLIEVEKIELSSPRAR